MLPKRREKCGSTDTTVSCVTRWKRVIIGFVNFPDNRKITVNFFEGYAEKPHESRIFEKGVSKNRELTGNLCVEKFRLSLITFDNLCLFRMR